MGQKIRLLRMLEGPYFWLTSSKHFNQISTTFGILQCCFILNTSAYSKFIKFIKVAPPSEINNSDFAFNEC